MVKKIFSIAAIAIFAAGAAILTSCNKEDEVINDDYHCQLKTKDVKNVNMVIEQYGRLVSKALLNPGFRGELKKAVMEKFDGDYDVLAINLKPDSLQVYSGMAEILKNTYNESLMGEYGKTYDEFLSNTFGIIPNLQISVPVNCDNWNTSSYMPYVLPLHIDQKEGKGVKVQAFNGSGEICMFDMGEEPSVPVVVVSISERVDEKLRFKKYLGYSFTPMDSTPPVPTELSIDRIYGGELQLHWSDVAGELGYRVLKKAGPGDFVEIATTNANQNYYVDDEAVPGVWNQYMICSYNENGNSSVMKYLGKHASYRDVGTDLKLSSIRFDDEDELELYEAWARGCPELRLYIIGGNESTNSAVQVGRSNVLEPPSRKSIYDSDGWSPNNVIVVENWTTGSHGDILTFFWLEEDGGSSATLNIEAKVEASLDSLFGGILGGYVTLEYKMPINFEDNDDTIGTRDVYFWDPLTKEYSIKGFNWTLQCVN